MKEMVNKILSDDEVERKEQREFAKSVMEFINAYTNNSVKRSDSDTPMRSSYMVNYLNSDSFFVDYIVITVFNNNSYYN